MSSLPSIPNSGRATWDVIIIGAGPAGAACALTLARAGHQVLLLDKSEFPRDKICGDQLLPDSLRVLTKLGLIDRVRTQALAFESLRIFSPSRVDFVVACQYLSISRRHLDAILVSAFTEAGGSFAAGKVADVKPSAEGPAEVSVEGLSSPLRAEIVVIATGTSINLADKIGVIANRQPSAVAMRAYYESDYQLEHNLMCYDRSLLPGFGWVFRVGENLYNMGCGRITGNDGAEGTSLREATETFFDEFPYARAIVKNGRRVSELSGAPLRCGLAGCREYVKDNVVCIGEVIGTTHPFTGAGIGPAMQSGVMAGEAIDQALQSNIKAPLLEYTRRIDSKMRPIHQGYLVAQNWLSHPWIGDLLSRRIRKSRFLQHRSETVMAGTADPRELFSFSSILRSFWK